MLLPRPLARRTSLAAFKSVSHEKSPLFLRSITTSTTTSDSESKKSTDEASKSPTKPSEEAQLVKKKTQAELDKELELKMQGLAGDGGESGLELEDGKAVSMKRGVRNNMFRYI